MVDSKFKDAVHVTRGGIVESVHAAAIAVSDPAGKLLAVLGDPGIPIILRSAAKPFQTAALIASGAVARYGFSETQIALIAGSHAGEEIHQETARGILETVGLTPDALQCGAHVPFSRRVAAELAREGREPTVLMNNCSGKHSGMLASAQAAGDPTATYLDPSHPVQRANLASLAAFSGRPAGEIGVAVDGCSAPTFSVTLAQAARAFSRLSAGANGHMDRALAEAGAAASAAMRAHPEMVAGEGLMDTILMRAVPGLLAKVGADGIHAMSWAGPDGPVGVALKIMDGDVGRARTAAVLEVLAALGALPGGPPPELAESLTVRNHRGLEVGRVKAVFRLERPGPA